MDNSYPAQIRQLIIARKDLHMSPGKLAAQVSHASMAFLSYDIRRHTKKISLAERKTLPSWQINPDTLEKMPHIYKRTDLTEFARKAYENGEEAFSYRAVNPLEPDGELELCGIEPEERFITTFEVNPEIFEGWFCGQFTKTVCEAKNRSHLMKATEIAISLNLIEGKDFFLIKDNCLTELEPEETDEAGQGRTLTCIGFRPLPDSVAHQISRKYQLYR